MHSIRKLVLMGLAALIVCGAMASSAFAVQARTGSSSGTPLAVGATVNGTNSGNVILSGTFFGIPNTTTCTSSAVSGAVLANATAAGNVWGTIASLTFTGCTSTAYPAGCNVTVNGLTWSPASPGGNGGGLEAISTTTVRLGTGTGTINVSDCQPNKGTCLLKGLTAGPATDTGYSLSNYVTGTWTNPNGSTSPPQLSINSAVGIQTCTATSTNWTAKYTLRDASSNLIYLG